MDDKSEDNYAFLTLTVDPEVKRMLDIVSAYRGVSKNAWIGRKFGDAIASAITDEFQMVPPQHRNIAIGRRRRTAIGSAGFPVSSNG